MIVILILFFQGVNDVETLRNIRNAEWQFDQQSFANVSEEGQDFLKKLLVKEKQKRMTVHQCLEHPWLKNIIKSDPIPKEKYHDIRNKFRKTSSQFKVPIGKLAECGALRKLAKMDDYLMDKKCAAPRFVIKPDSNTKVNEGQSAKFKCKIISLTGHCFVSWFHNNVQLKQSVKYMKRNDGDWFTFVINRVKMSDWGEFVIRAENQFGVKEEIVFLNVQPNPISKSSPQPDKVMTQKKTVSKSNYDPFKKDSDSAPLFTFHLRPRVIQQGQKCKLLACVSSKPNCQIQWMRSNTQLKSDDYAMTHSDGVVTLEIFNAKPGDSGKYRCLAFNDLGSDETECVVIVEGVDMTDEMRFHNQSVFR